MSRDHDKFYYDYENKTKLFSRYLNNFKKVADQIHLGLYFWKRKFLRNIFIFYSRYNQEAIVFILLHKKKKKKKAQKSPRKKYFVPHY